jgi:hypothetical protein
MHDTQDKIPSIDWVRERFGIEDEDELRAVLNDPDAVLALLDVARTTGQDWMPAARSRVGHIA